VPLTGCPMDHRKADFGERRFEMRTEAKASPQRRAGVN
jgi:hypothetical protein